jgi:hypothetical protein
MMEGARPTHTVMNGLLYSCLEYDPWFAFWKSKDIADDWEVEIYKRTWWQFTSQKEDARIVNEDNNDSKPKQGNES